MKRSMLQVALFALFLLVGRVCADPVGEPTVPLIEWKWEVVKLEKTDKKLGDKATFKLTASGMLIFVGTDNSVSAKDSKMELRLADLLLSPNIFPANPNETFKVTVDAPAKVPPYIDRYGYKITAITTIDGSANGEAYLVFEGYKAKITPIITYTVGGKTTTNTFDPPGYAEAK